MDGFRFVKRWLMVIFIIRCIGKAVSGPAKILHGQSPIRLRFSTVSSLLDLRTVKTEFEIICRRSEMVNWQLRDSFIVDEVMTDRGVRSRVLHVRHGHRRAFEHFYGQTLVEPHRRPVARQPHLRLLVFILQVQCSSYIQKRAVNICR